MKNEIKIYKKERELLLKLLEDYEPKTKLEEDVKFSAKIKIQKAYDVRWHFSEVSIKEIEEKLKTMSPYQLYFCMPEIGQEYLGEYLSNQMKKTKGLCVNYSDEFWTGIEYLSNGDILYPTEGVERLRVENEEAYKKLVEKVKVDLKNKI